MHIWGRLFIVHLGIVDNNNVSIIKRSNAGYKKRLTKSVQQGRVFFLLSIVLQYDIYMIVIEVRIS